MNERIKELGAQAARLTTDELARLARIHNRCMSVEESYEVYDQKFAELIIKECSQIAKVAERTSDLGWYRIEQHFGITT